MDSVVRIGPPLFESDAVVFGLLIAVLALIFYATTMPLCAKFFNYIPAFEGSSRLSPRHNSSAA